MDDKQFDELLHSVGDMGRHMRGQAVAGTKVRDFPEPDVKAIRELLERQSQPPKPDNTQVPQDTARENTASL